MKIGPDFAAERFGAGACHGKSAEGGWCGVIGMTFELCADLEERIGVEGLAGEFVEAVQDAETDGHGTAHAAGLRDFAFDGPIEMEGRKAGGFEKGRGGHGGHGGMDDGIAEADRDAVMDLECDSEGIVARAEVGGSGGYLDGNGAHNVGIFGGGMDLGQADDRDARGGEVTRLGLENAEGAPTCPAPFKHFEAHGETAFLKFFEDRVVMSGGIGSQSWKQEGRGAVGNNDPDFLAENGFDFFEPERVTEGGGH